MLEADERYVFGLERTLRENQQALRDLIEAADNTLKNQNSSKALDKLYELTERARRVLSETENW